MGVSVKGPLNGLLLKIDCKLNRTRVKLATGLIYFVVLAIPYWGCSVCLMTERIHHVQCLAAKAKKKVLKKNRVGKALTAAKVILWEYQFAVNCEYQWAVNFDSKNIQWCTQYL